MCIKNEKKKLKALRFYNDSSINNDLSKTKLKDKFRKKNSHNLPRAKK
jgi:hypothetical protein